MQQNLGFHCDYRNLLNVKIVRYKSQQIKYFEQFRLKKPLSPLDFVKICSKFQVVGIYYKSNTQKQNH